MPEIHYAREETMTQELCISRLRKHSKVRTGCITCKRRRVKCDETKPSCRKCSSFGRACEGYQIPKTWLFEPESPDHPHTPTTQLVKSYPSSLQSPAEQRAFLFFRKQTAPLLAPFTSLTSRFWHEVVPRTSLSVPAIWHVTAAIAYRHEAIEATSPKDPSIPSTLAIKHYATAVKLLTQPDLSAEVLLMASCLFIACENFQDSVALVVPSSQGLTHLISGLKILKSLGSANQSQSHWLASTSIIITEAIAPILVQMEVVISMFLMPQTLIQPLPTTKTKRPTLPLSFSNLKIAQDLFFQICRWRFLNHETSPLDPSWTETSHRYLDIQLLLTEWHALLHAYASRHTDPTEKQAVAVMMRQYRLLYMAFHYSTYPPSTSGDERMVPQSVDLSDPHSTKVTFALDRRTWNQQVGQDWRVESDRPPATTQIPIPTLWPVVEAVMLDGKEKRIDDDGGGGGGGGGIVQLTLRSCLGGRREER